MLMQPADVQAALEHSGQGLRVLDARPGAEYVAAHVPSAVWVDVKTWQEQGRKEGGLHDARAWGQLVGGLGVSRDTPVAVYGGSLPDAARVWWMLKYLGVAHVTLMDGGWPLWQREHRPTDATVPRVHAVAFEPQFQADRLEEIGTLKEAVRSGRVSVLDARSEGEFAGRDVRGTRGGHIPKSKLLEWKELLETDGRFKSTAELRALFQAHGIDPGQTAVTC
jgi:thiosulfate/3-mercaptopyruvate sulfurtransferase